MRKFQNITWLEIYEDCAWHKPLVLRLVEIDVASSAVNLFAVECSCLVDFVLLRDHLPKNVADLVAALAGL